MSKFIDKLHRVSQAVPQPMGFRGTQPAREKPKILLIASPARTDIDGTADYMAGADAGLLHISNLSSGAKTLRTMRQIAPDVPWGGWLTDVGKEGMKQLIKAGCDFVVFPAADTPLAILQDDKVGRVLQVDVSLNEGLLRAVNELPIDAVLIASEQKGEYILTWHHLMLFQRFADLLTKPLLVSIPPDVTVKELQVLWEAGVNGIVIEVGPEQSTARLKELRQTIDKLTFSPLRKQKKIDALLPHISEDTGIVAEDEDEEEEE